MLARLSFLPAGDMLHLSVITHAEIHYGIGRIPPGRRRRSLERAYALLLPHFGQLLDVTVVIAEGYAGIKAGLERRGIVLPENDLWIAATAIEGGQALVTDDSHFAAVPGLTTENWLRP